MDSETFDTSEIAKMKVPELKKELKARGLSTTGNKNELVERLQEALKSKRNDDESTSILENVDDLEEHLLNDDDDEHLDGSDSVLVDIDNPLELSTSMKSTKRLSEDGTNDQPKPKKLVLNRVISSANDTHDTNGSSINVSTTDKDNTDNSSEEKKVIKLSELTMKERLERRAQKFGAATITDDVKKVARAERFGSTTSNTNTASGKITLNNAGASIDVLKQRAQRFGVNVSNMMSKLEEQERLEKRKERFGVVTSTNGTTDTNDKAKQRLERFKQ